MLLIRDKALGQQAFVSRTAVLDNCMRGACKCEPEGLIRAGLPLSVLTWESCYIKTYFLNQATEITLKCTLCSAFFNHLQIDTI